MNMEHFNSTALPEGPAAMATNPDAAQNSVSQELIDVITNCRENVKVRRAAVVEVPEGSTGFIAPYIHNELPTPEEIKAYIDSVVGSGIQVKFGGSAALLAVTHTGPFSDDTLQLTRKLAMQAVAARPQFLGRDNVPKDIVDKEKEIIMATLSTEGKDPAIVEKMINGKLNKFYEGSVLLDQQFLITNDTNKPKIGELLEKDAAKPVVVQMLRFERGEGVEAGSEE
jgi:elongation factor Ts